MYFSTLTSFIPFRLSFLLNFVDAISKRKRLNCQCACVNCFLVSFSYAVVSALMSLARVVHETFLL